MRSLFYSILFLVIILLIILGLAAFLFRQTIQENLHGQIKQPIKTPLESIKPSSQEAENLKVLASENFLKLKNNLFYFNFEDICGRLAEQEVGVISGQTATQTTKCFLGNSRPLVGSKLSE